MTSNFCRPCSNYSLFHHDYYHCEVASQLQQFWVFILFCGANSLSLTGVLFCVSHLSPPPTLLPGTGVGHEPAREVGSGLGHHGPLSHPGQGQHNRALAAALPGSAQGRGKGSSRSETPSFAQTSQPLPPPTPPRPGFLREPSAVVGEADETNPLWRRPPGCVSSAT